MLLSEAFYFTLLHIITVKFFMNCHMTVQEKPIRNQIFGNTLVKTPIYIQTARLPVSFWLFFSAAIMRSISFQSRSSWGNFLKSFCRHLALSFTLPASLLVDFIITWQVKYLTLLKCSACRVLTEPTGPEDPYSMISDKIQIQDFDDQRYSKVKTVGKIHIF